MKIYSYVGENPIKPITDEERFIAEISKGESVLLNASATEGVSLHKEGVDSVNDKMIINITNGNKGMSVTVDSYGSKGDKFGSFYIDSSSGDIGSDYIKELLEGYMIEVSA